MVVGSDRTVMAPALGNIHTVEACSIDYRLHKKQDGVKSLARRLQFTSAPNPTCIRGADISRFARWQMFNCCTHCLPWLPHWVRAGASSGAGTAGFSTGLPRQARASTLTSLPLGDVICGEDQQFERSTVSLNSKKQE